MVSHSGRFVIVPTIDSKPGLLRVRYGGDARRQPEHLADDDRPKHVEETTCDGGETAPFVKQARLFVTGRIR